ncbi:MAG TPA: secondary thiamine-phosphate synthase enzyme YjbQ [Anaeromyxobacteraceae bacterium]|nr:secondary thiamine-phosphate synthase enzyme YjbQ [Anaeromyxobacteraceae bacterium]
MKSQTRYLTMNTPRRRELVRITDEVSEFCAGTDIEEGLLLVSAMHITAAVFVNDDEPGLHSDIEDWLQRLAPGPSADGRSPGPDYRHHSTGEDNGDAHLKNLLLGHQVIVPITGGRLDLGPWQQVFYFEFDGRRPKRVVLKAIGE